MLGLLSLSSSNSRPSRQARVPLHHKGSTHRVGAQEGDTTPQTPHSPVRTNSIRAAAEDGTLTEVEEVCVTASYLMTSELFAL
jgi:hypothetical protein